MKLIVDKWTDEKPKVDGYYLLKDICKHGSLTSIVYITRIDRQIQRIGTDIKETFNPYTMLRSVHTIKLPYELED